MNDQGTLEQGIRRLLRNREFRALRRRQERFRPFQAFGIEWREHSHSDFLAYLLDPQNPHGLGEQFLREFIALAADSPAITNKRKKPLPVKAELGLDSALVTISRERYGIDIIIDCYPNGPVIGIEVKIWATEQEKQVSRYQEKLASSYLGRDSMMVYLTPYGRKPDTGTENHDVPCVTMSWRDIASTLDDITGDGSISGEALPFIDAFSKHLRESFMGDEKARDLTGSIFKDPELVMLFRTIEQNRPRLWNEDISKSLFDKCNSIARAEIGSEITESQYKKELVPGSRAFLPMIPMKWKSKDINIPICLAFYHEPSWKEQPWPALQVVLYDADVEKTGDDSSDDLKFRWEKLFSESDVFEKALTKVRCWTGYKVFNSKKLRVDHESIGWIIRDESFDEDWMDKAAGIFKEKLKLVNDELERVMSPAKPK